MILQALVDYYEQLVHDHPGDIAQEGWSSCRVSFLVDIDDAGHLVNIIPSEEKRGWTMIVPEQVKRASGIAANLLCDNATYLFGLDAKEKLKRAVQCFEAARDLHLEVLGDVDSEAAKAVCAFFSTWNPSDAPNHPVIKPFLDALLKGGRLVFRLRRREVLTDPAIRDAWERRYLAPSDNDKVMTCLVSGRREPIARLHPAIKGIVGAQSTGASLVGFNNRSFESYGHEKQQGLNAPVGKRYAFAYTTALNYLLSDSHHRVRLGDTTIVFWSVEDDDVCSEAVSVALFGRLDEEENPDKKIESILGAVSQGKPLGDASLDTRFFILGLAPNAARASVRFFLQSTFGEVLRNIARHYERLEIVHADFESRFLTPYQLLRETENQNATKHEEMSVLAAPLLRAILSDTNYPESLYRQTLLRIHATQDNPDKHQRKITRGRVAIIKAYLLKNRHRNEKEVTVALNEERNDIPYLLGRLFSTLEAIQSAANPKLNTTIKNRYFDSANITPGVVFPSLIRLGYHHLDKLSKTNSGLGVALQKSLNELLDRIDDFPKRLSADEQGAFILGYQQQTQKRYGKKSDKEDK